MITPPEVTLAIAQALAAALRHVRAFRHVPCPAQAAAQRKDVTRLEASRDAAPTPAAAHSPPSQCLAPGRSPASSRPADHRAAIQIWLTFAASTGSTINTAG